MLYAVEVQNLNKMAKRKYARMGEKIVRYECTKQKCKWQGTDEEKVTLRNQKSGWNEHCCPKCGNNEFYGLLQ